MEYLVINNSIYPQLSPRSTRGATTLIASVLAGDGIMDEETVRGVQFRGAALVCGMPRNSQYSAPASDSAHVPLSSLPHDRDAFTKMQTTLKTQQHNPARTGRVDDLFDPSSSSMQSPAKASAAAQAARRDKMAAVMGAGRGSIFGAMLEVGHEDRTDPVSCWQKTRTHVWSIFSIRADNRMAVTNFKLRVGSVVFTVASLSCFVVMLIFCYLTPTPSATLIILALVWGLVCVPIGAIYQYMLWEKQTVAKQSATSTGNAVSWRLEWFIEWKYRLILLLLLMTVLFHMGLTTFVVQASNKQVMEQVLISFNKEVLEQTSSRPGYLIALTALVAGVGIGLSVEAFLHHTRLIKYDNFDDVERRHRPIVSMHSVVDRIHRPSLHELFSSLSLSHRAFAPALALIIFPSRRSARAARL